MPLDSQSTKGSVSCSNIKHSWMDVFIPMLVATSTSIFTLSPEIMILAPHQIDSKSRFWTLIHVRLAPQIAFCWWYCSFHRCLRTPEPDSQDGRGHEPAPIDLISWFNSVRKDHNQHYWDLSDFDPFSRLMALPTAWLWGRSLSHPSPFHPDIC